MRAFVCAPRAFAECSRNFVQRQHKGRDSKAGCPLEERDTRRGTVACMHCQNMSGQSCGTGICSVFVLGNILLFVLLPSPTCEQEALAENRYEADSASWSPSLLEGTPQRGSVHLVPDTPHNIALSLRCKYATRHSFRRRIRERTSKKAAYLILLKNFNL